MYGIQQPRKIGEMWFWFICWKKKIDQYTVISMAFHYYRKLEKCLQQSYWTKIHKQDVLPEAQCGFWAERGTGDMILSVWQIYEKCIEPNLDLHQCFIDLTKAFDTVNSKMLWKV